MIATLTVLITCLQLWRRGLLRPVLRCDRGVLYWQPTVRGLAVAGRMRTPKVQFGYAEILGKE